MNTDTDPTYRVAVSSHALTAKIPPGDPFWPKFNASFTNYNMTCNDLAAAVFGGYPFTTWHSNNWRKGENYLCGQHLGLDFDGGDQSCTLDALSKDKFVARYAAFIYTTVSHTPEKPKARVLFLLDTPIVQAQNYTLAAQALIWHFCTADAKCKDSVRFFYGSQGCDMAYLDNVLPLSVVKGMIAKWQDVVKQQRKEPERPEFTPPSQREVIDALERINPWQIEYDEWVKILMALHCEFGDDALRMAERWAKGKEGEVEHKWRGFKNNGNTSGKATIATVFGIAKRFGWQYQKAA